MTDRRTFLKRSAGAAVAPVLVLPGLRGAEREDRPSTNSSNMKIIRNGEQKSAPGPGDWFTGEVRIDPLFQPEGGGRAGGASVTFEPGARTAWHTHPIGQTLIVTSGVGRVQVEGGPIEEIRPGDVVWFPRG